MEEVASRLGYGAGNSLCAWEPRLCARLIERRRRFAEQSKKALKNRLKVVLKENPPPSLREVHARLGVTSAISRNFPEKHSLPIVGMQLANGCKETARVPSGLLKQAA